jgi:hypothetical protein
MNKGFASLANPAPRKTVNLIMADFSAQVPHELSRIVANACLGPGRRQLINDDPHSGEFFLCSAPSLGVCPAEMSREVIASADNRNKGRKECERFR